MPTPEERIAEAFDRRFATFDIHLDPADVKVGERGSIRARGWLIMWRVVPDDAGSPSLEFYATHRMTDDEHVRIWADGHVEQLDAIYPFYGFDPKVPGSEEAAKEKYLTHNRKVAEELRASGLYPDGDINAYLRTGQDQADDEPEQP